MTTAAAANEKLECTEKTTNRNRNEKNNDDDYESVNVSELSRLHAQQHLLQIVQTSVRLCIGCVICIVLLFASFLSLYLTFDRSPFPSLFNNTFAYSEGNGQYSMHNHKT